EALLILPQHVGMFTEEPDALDQAVAEIDSVERLEPLLISHIELLALVAREACGLAVGNLVGREAAVLPTVDQLREHARRPALLVDALGLQELLEQPDLVVDVENCKVGLELHHLGVAAQNLDA